MMAMREPGIFFVNFGVTAIRMMLPMPTARASQLTVPKLWKYAAHFDRKSAGTLSMVSPKRSLIWVVKMVRAIPLVKPTTMG